jgi:ABC-type uncharacterized transport system substrate-binding protein
MRKNSEIISQHSVLVVALCAVLFALSASAQAQQLPRIGYLGGGSAELEKPWIGAFQQGLRDLGYVEGNNIVIERRYAAGRYEQLPGLIAQLLALKVDVILAASTPVALSTKKTTTSTPIVMVVADPVGTGLVASLAQPGGNITGLSDFHADLVTKRLELLKEVTPSLARVVFSRTRRALRAPHNSKNSTRPHPG